MNKEYDFIEKYIDFYFGLCYNMLVYLFVYKYKFILMECFYETQKTIKYYRSFYLFSFIIEL